MKAMMKRRGSVPDSGLDVTHHGNGPESLTRHRGLIRTSCPENVAGLPFSGAWSTSPPTQRRADAVAAETPSLTTPVADMLAALEAQGISSPDSSVGSDTESIGLSFS